MVKTVSIVKLSCRVESVVRCSSTISWSWIYRWLISIASKCRWFFLGGRGCLIWGPIDQFGGSSALAVNTAEVFGNFIQ